MHHLDHSHVGQNDSALQHEAVWAILNFTSILTGTHTRWRRPRRDEKSRRDDGTTTTKKNLYTVTFHWERQARPWHHSTTRCFPRLLWKRDFVHFHFNWDTRLIVQRFKDFVVFFFVSQDVRTCLRTKYSPLVSDWYRWQWSLALLFGQVVSLSNDPWSKASLSARVCSRLWTVLKVTTKHKDVIILKSEK